MVTESEQSDPRLAIEHTAHFLPAQGPIMAFVHHNTLHAMEEQPFEQAVVQGGKIFECHPYLPGDRYREKLSRGHILPEDIEAVLTEDLGDRADGKNKQYSQNQTRGRDLLDQEQMRSRICSRDPISIKKIIDDMQLAAETIADGIDPNRRTR